MYIVANEEEYFRLDIFQREMISKYNNTWIKNKQPRVGHLTSGREYSFLKFKLTNPFKFYTFLYMHKMTIRFIYTYIDKNINDFWLKWLFSVYTAIMEFT